MKLIFMAGRRLAALPTDEVDEVMRPLPIDQVAGVPTFVLGVSVIRGQPTPVVDLGRLVSGERATTPGHFVTVRLGNRAVALAVETIVGVRQVEADTFAELPPLLGELDATVAKVGALDRSLLMVLRRGRFLDGPLWERMSTALSATL